MKIFVAFASREIAKKFFNIKNKYILKAISRHTISNSNIFLIDKIIIVSDIIDVKNDFLGLKKIWDFAEKNLHLLTILAFKYIFKYLSDKEKKICQISINSWNSLLDVTN